MAAIPFGQEIAITPLQMLCSTNAIANDGVMMKPFIVRSIMDGQRTAMEFSPQESSSPISARTARIMRQILTRSVENGTGENARVHGYQVAGKTGTSQKASGAEGYLPDKYISSFVGFLSGKGLTISMIVVIDEPRGDEHTGGAVACPVFRDIATQVMQYLTIGQRSCAVELRQAG
jgi:stage V sporulation protein D (sporulation-specific penicillin-binding protein)